VLDSFFVENCNGQYRRFEILLILQNNTVMKKLFFIAALFFGHHSFAQTITKIDTSNYFTYLSPKNVSGSITTDWLRLNDVVPIMLEELKRAGYDWLSDRPIYKLKDGQYITLSAYSGKNNIGFLYIEGHSIPLSKSYRNILFQKDNSKLNYTQDIQTYSGNTEFVTIKGIPSNIFVLKEDCYFFQYTGNANDNKFLVTKEIAIEILRQDIRKYLAMAPKPKE
jgi:hypothetical protein